MTPAPLKRLTALPEALIARGFDPPAYRYIRDAAINGLFPVKRVNHIFHYRPADIEVIERALRGMAHLLPEKPLPDAPRQGKKRNGTAKGLAAAA